MDEGTPRIDKDSERSAERAVVNTLLAHLQQQDSYDPACVPVIYDELRRLVRFCQQYQRAGNAPRAQPVLREAFAKLFGVRMEIPERGQLSILAELLRRLLVDYARIRQLRDTRGGMGALIADFRRRLDTVNLGVQVDVLAMDEALSALERRHVFSVRLIELKYFADLGSLDIAIELGVSTVAAERGLRFAKTWLFSYLQHRGDV